MFKNLAIFSKMNNVAGISSSGSQKAMDMFFKCQYITETSGNRGIVFATGTPIYTLYTWLNYKISVAHRGCKRYPFGLSNKSH